MAETRHTPVTGANGVQYGLKWGFGKVYSVTTPKNRVNGRVEFQVDGLQHRVGGSIHLRNQKALIEQLKASEGTEQYWAYRVESHRDEKYDKDVPFLDIASDTDLAKEVLHSRLIAAAPEASPEGDAIITQCMADAGQQTSPWPLSTGSTPVENQPTMDQAPGESWEFAARMSCVDLAFETLVDQSGSNFTSAQMEALARLLLRIVDSAQTTFSGRLDRAGRCHTRARGALRTALKRFPVPADYEGDEAVEWEKKATASVVLMLRTADKILKPEEAA